MPWRDAASRKRPATRRRSRRYQQALVVPVPTMRPLARTWAFPVGRAVSALLLLAIGLLAYILYADDRFYVDQVVVQGNRYVPAHELIVASGLANQSIFFVNVSASERALVRLPGVREANVIYRWPNLITLKIQERQPVLVWQTRSQTYWADAEGVLFPARARLSDLPTINASGPLPIQGEPPRLDSEWVTLAQVLANEWPDVKTLDYAPTTGLSFAHPRAGRVLIGDLKDLPAKLAVLRSLLRHFETHKIQVEYVDLRLPQQPYYKPQVSP